MKKMDFKLVQRISDATDKPKNTWTQDVKNIKKAHEYYKKCWDNYGDNLSKLSEDKYECTVAHLKREFPTDRYCKEGMPLTYMKDLMKLPLEEIFDKMWERLNKPLINRVGEKTTLARTIWRYIQKWHNIEKGADYNHKYLAIAFNLEVYRNALGTHLEEVTHKLLKEHYKNDPNYEYLVASQKDEWKDIDGILREKWNPYKTVEKISIKTMGALTKYAISKKRFGSKPKTEPTLYVGVKSLNDQKLIFIQAEDILPPEYHNWKNY